MLVLTNDAVSAIRTLTHQPGLPEETGLRIASSAVENGKSSLAAEVASSPQPSDQVVEAEGARVFLDESAATELDDKALDAQTNEQGQVWFQVTEKPG